VQLLRSVADEERENCCDMTVLQFGYDKISYATALLTLEKLSYRSPVFALRAIGRKNLRSRIEKIVGVKTKPDINFNYLGSITAAVVLIFGLNLLSISTRQKDAIGLSFNNWVNPFYFFQEGEIKKTSIPRASKFSPSLLAKQAKDNIAPSSSKPAEAPGNIFPVQNPFAIHASFSEKTNVLDKETEVERTVEATKILLETVQWQEIENSIGDGLTEEEKLQAKQEYFKEVERIDWNGLQTSLIAEYDQINWNRLNLDLKALLTVAASDTQYLNPQQILDSKASECTNYSQVIPIPDSARKLPQNLMLQDSLIKLKGPKSISQPYISL